MIPPFCALSQVLVPLVLLQALQREGQSLTALLPLGSRFLEEEQAGYILREGGWVSCSSCALTLPLACGTATSFQFNVSDYRIVIPVSFSLGGAGDVLELKQLGASTSFLFRRCKRAVPGPVRPKNNTAV